VRYDQDHESADVEDRRGQGPVMGGGGGGGGLFSLIPLLLRFRYGWVVVLGIVAYGAFTSLTGDPSSSLANGAAGTGAAPASSVVHDAPAHFVAFVLDDVQSFWTKDFERRGKTYPHAKLVLFTGATPTACGAGRTAQGPFYCPMDQQVYIDLAFYQELEDRLGARGQFAKAYVIAHEIGHHVQHLLGADRRAGSHDEGASGGSVRLELQADCYAGVWAHSTEQRSILEQGDIESALGAAQAIGDDKLQKDAVGTVRPDTFTHGTSAQRVRWFKQGYTTGALEQCDTFAANPL
jgi:predicted metalloprotease